MSLRRVEGVWLAQSFLDDFILIYPVYAIMMLESGISAFQLSVLFIIWSLSSLVFEIPSGVVGDLVNRKAYVFVGSAIKGCGYLIWLGFPGFAGFALGFVLWSLGSAVHSGTLQALLHDLLAERGQTDAFSRLYGRGRAASSLGVLVGMMLGGFAAEPGFAAESGYDAVLLLSALAPFASGALVLFGLPDIRRSSVGWESGRLATTLATALQALRGNRVLLLNAVMFVCFMGMSGVVDEYVGPLLAAPGILTLGVIGVLYGIILGARALGAALAHRLRHIPLRRIGLLSLAAHMMLLASQAGQGLWLAGGCALYFAVMGAVEVLLETNVQREIEVDARATITSVAGAGLEVWGVGLFLVIGLAADAMGWAVAVGLVAMLAALLSAGFSWVAGRGAAGG
jgi:MFS family permease